MQLKHTMLPTTLKRVFVYGTLKRNYDRGDILTSNGAKLDSYSRVYGYLLHRGAFPAVVLAEKGQVIGGEIWDNISPELLKILDNIEGIPTHYQRVAIETATKVVAWIYVQPPEALSDEIYIVPGGDWYGPTTTKKKFKEFWENVHAISGPARFEMPTKPKVEWMGAIGEMVVRQKSMYVWNPTEPVSPPKPVTPYEGGGCIPGVPLVWAGTDDEVPEKVVEEQSHKGF